MKDEKTKILWLDNYTDNIFNIVDNNIELEEGNYYKNKYNYCEYDIVVINFSDIGKLVGEYYSHMREEIQQFIHQRKTLIFLNYDPNKLLEYYNGKATCSHIYDLGVGSIKKTGSKIKKQYPEGKANDSFFKYSIVYKIDQKSDKELICSDDGNSFVIGFSKLLEDCHIVAIPFFKQEDGLLDDSFIKELLAIRDYLELKANDLPEWSKEYGLPREIQAKNEINEIKINIETLSKRKEELEVVVKEEEEFKPLFTGTGEPLRVLVGEVFETIGFKVDFHDEYEEDLNIRYDNKRFLVEVSGVNKGLKYDKLIRHHGRVISEKEKDESVLKGLLVINTFKDIPLDERIDKTHFSEENILPYSKQHRLCVMTGLTLLNLFLKKRDSKISADEIFRLICETDGVLEIEDNYILKKE